MAYLTINADDFGLTKEVTLGIQESISNGIVTSTGAMVCVKGARQNIQAYASKTKGSIGAHLQLTDGKPILAADEIPSLTDKNGMFYSKSKDLPWILNAEQIYNEWKAQIAQLLSIGIRPEFLDTHHNVHMRSQVLPTLAKLSLELNIPVRSGSSLVTNQLRFLGASCPDVTIINYFGKDLSWERIEYLICKERDNLGEDAVIELSCHPGYSSNELEEISYYTKDREIELKVLTSEKIKNRISKLGFQLIPMKDVNKLRPVNTNKIK